MMNKLEVKGIQKLINYANIQCSIRGLIFSSKWLSDLLDSLTSASSNGDENLYNTLNHENFNQSINLYSTQNQKQFTFNNFSFDINYYNNNLNFSQCSQIILNSEYIMIKSWLDGQCWDRFWEFDKSEIEGKLEVVQFLKLYGLFMKGEKSATEVNFDDTGKKIDLPAIPNPYLNYLRTLLEDLLKVEDNNESCKGGDPFLLQLLGMIYSRLNMKLNAIQYLIFSLQKFPYNWLAIEELINLIDNSNLMPQLTQNLPQSFIIQFLKLKLILEFNTTEKLKFWEIYTELINLFPNSNYLIFQRALSFYHLRKFNQSKIIFETLYLQNPSILDYIDIYSNILYVLNETQALFQLTIKCTKLDKFRPETCKVLANFYSSQNKHTEAIKYLYRALMLNSKDFSIWILLGHEYMELKNEQAALQCYKNSTEYNSKDYRGWYGLGQIYELLTLYQYSLYSYQKSCTLNPDDSRAWASLAKIYLYLNQPNFAISCFERSLECDEKLPFVTFRLGTLYRNSKNTELAVKYFELAISQNFYRDGLYSESELSSLYLYLAEYLFSKNEWTIDNMKIIKGYLTRVMDLGCEEVEKARTLMNYLASKEQETNQ